MTHYLSRFQVTAKTHKVHKLNNRYAFHRLVYSLFPEGASKNNRILFSVNANGANRYEVLVLSGIFPASPSPEAVNLETIEVPDSFYGHRQYRFQVDINAVTRSSKTPSRADMFAAVSGEGSHFQNPKPIRDAASIRDWFAGKAQSQWGFIPNPANLEAGVPNVHRFNRVKGDKQNEIVVSVSTVTGILQVSDSDRFFLSATKGIGRSRSWGCGLLQLSPVD